MNNTSKLSLQYYGGELWAVDYNSKSLGCTLFTSTNENAARQELNKFQSMSDKELNNWMMTKYSA